MKHLFSIAAAVAGAVAGSVFKHAGVVGRVSGAWTGGSARLAAIAVLALGVSACVAPGPVHEAMVCGQKVTFHPDDLKPCNSGASACSVLTSGQGYNVYYSTMDQSVLGHEEEHVCGMRHKEPWVSVGGKACTVVTEAGNTAWKKGDVMCRVDSGPPVKITDTRVQALLVGSR